MIKIIGAMLLVGGATILGLSAASALSVRTKSLKGFIAALGIMHSEIGERLTPMEEVVKILSKLSPSPVSEFFTSCAEEMEKRQDVPFCLIWRKAVKCSDYMKLKAFEREEIANLGNVLGRYSAEEQKKAIEHTMRCLEGMCADAEEEKKRLGGLYAKLGFICGIGIVIVFI